MASELTLVLLKPDALERSLTGAVLTQLSGEGLEIVAAKVVKVSEGLARAHYAEHEDKPFFDELVRYLKGEFHNRKKVLALVYSGHDAIARIREKIGPTNPMVKTSDHEPTTIRQKYGRVVPVKAPDGEHDLVVDGHVVLRFENVIHGSTREDAEKEIKLWFQPEEIISEARIYATERLTAKIYRGAELAEEKDVLVWKDE